MDPDYEERQLRSAILRQTITTTTTTTRRRTQMEWIDAILNVGGIISGIILVGLVAACWFAR